MNLIKQNSHWKPVSDARVSICGSILYKITSWQNPLSTWRLTKKIMSASQTDMCAPLQRPLLQHHCLWADNLLSLEPHATPAYSQSLSLSAPSAFTPRVKDLNDQANPHPAGLTLLMWIKGREPWGFSAIEVCQIIQRPNKCTPPPHYIFKNSPSLCPLLSLLPKHFPAAVI